MSLEAPKTSALVTIRYVVMSIINRNKIYSLNDYKRIAQLVIEGYGDLNLYHLNNIEVIYAYMDKAKTVTVPSDFVDWIKVGIPYRGKIYVLTKDEKILKPRQFPDGEDVGNLDAQGSNTVAFFTDHFDSAGRYVAGLYGLPGGFNTAYYRYDAEKRQFIFTGTIPRAEVVIEYISSGVKLTGSTLIPRQAVEPLQRYVAWQSIIDDIRIPLNRIMYAEKTYDNAVQKLVDFESTPTMQEYKDSLYRKIKQTLKR